jgi:hypothetical protein
MQVHIGDLPADPTFLQRVRHRELSDVSSEKLAKKLAALQSSAWDLPALKWHFSRHRVQVGVSTETEYAKLAKDVLGNPTRIFSEIYVDPFTVQRYGLGRLLSWEREEKIEQICDSLPRSWIFVDERAGRVVVVSDAGRILTLYAHSVPRGIADFVRNRLLPEAIEIFFQGETKQVDKNA